MDNNRMILPPLGGEVEIDHFQLIVFIEGGILTATNSEGKVISAYGSAGTYCFTGLTVGEWTITARLDEETSVSQSVSIIDETETQTIKMYYNVIPEFEYSGRYMIVNDYDQVITSSSKNWKIKFLTGGTLTFTNLKNKNNIDIFLVGGGAGGYRASANFMDVPSWTGSPGSGYTRTLNNISIDVDMPYGISIGSGGGIPSIAGGQTSAFGYNCGGGYGPPDGNRNSPYYFNGGSGGSGGAASGGYGGTDGYNGSAGGDGGTPGYGQRSNPGPNGETGNTREFGDPNGKLYSNGGQAMHGMIFPIENTGNAGGSSWGTVYDATSGSSGIVIIRNARATA